MRPGYWGQLRASLSWANDAKRLRDLFGDAEGRAIVREAERLAAEHSMSVWDALDHVLDQRSRE